MSRNGIVLLYLCKRKSRKSKNSMKGMVELCYDMPQWEKYLETSEVAFSEVQKVQLKNELHDFLSDAVLELVEENKLHLMKRLKDFLTNEEIFAGSSQIFQKMPSLPEEIAFDTDMTAFLEEEMLLGNVKALLPFFSILFEDGGMLSVSKLYIVAPKA